MELYSIEFKDENAELEAENAVIDISIVSNPSHDVNGLCFSKDFVQFSKMGEGKYIALLLRADYPIYRQPNPDMPNGGHVQFSKEFIRKIQEKNHAKKSFSFQHDNNQPINAQLIENWIVTDTFKDKTANYGIEASPGSWAGVLKFESDSDFERAREMQGGISLGFDPRIVGFKKVEQNQVSFNKNEENIQKSNQIINNNTMDTEKKKIVNISFSRSNQPSNFLKHNEVSEVKRQIMGNSNFLSKMDLLAQKTIKSLKFDSAEVLLDGALTASEEMVNAVVVEVANEISSIVEETSSQALAPLEQALAENEALKSELETLKAELEALKSSSQATNGTNTQFSAQEVAELKKQNEDLKSIVADKNKADLNFSTQKQKSENNGGYKIMSDFN